MSTGSSGVTPGAAPMPTPVGRSPMTWTDMSQHWTWPKLLRAIPLALAPSRLLLAFLLMMAFLGIDKACVAIFSADKVGTGPFSMLYVGLWEDASRLVSTFTWTGVNSGLAARALSKLFIEGPWEIVSSSSKWWMSFFIIILFGCFAIIGGAISRSAACDFAADVRISMGQSLAFAMKRMVSLIGAVLVPLVIVWLLCLLMAGAGYLLFQWGVVNLFGGILYFLFLIGSFIAAIVSIAYYFGAPMLAPAVAVEGTDAYDAVQRAYAYVFSKPVKLLLYGAVLIVAGVIAVSLVSTVVLYLISIAHYTTDAFNKDAASATRKASLWFVNFWDGIPLGIISAFVLSYFFSAGTVLYLAMRKQADGQEMDEVWMPSMVPGTVAAASSVSTAAAPSKPM